jgi:peptidoglycan/xylan/chitin deacetylase (PgdA/CDA1 family)
MFPTREARSEVDVVLGVVVGGIEMAEVASLAANEAQLAARAVFGTTRPNVGRAFAKEHFAREHDHVGPPLAELVPRTPRRPNMDRTVVAAALDGMRVPQLVMSLRRAASPWVTVLTYHRVADPHAAAMLDEGVVDVTPEQLDRQLAFVRRWFEPVGLDGLLAAARGVRPLPRNPVLITFDDGYRDNHDVALPILQRHGLRATFFIATDYVERRKPFWWDRVAYVLKRSLRDRIELDYPERIELALENQSARRRAIGRVQRLIKDRPGLVLEKLLEALERAAGVSLSRQEEAELVSKTVMTWEHVTSLRRAGMDVQSHTRTHRVLQTLGDDDLTNELRGSREKLEQVLGEPVVAISYPVGKPLYDAPRIKRAVREAGYELGFSNGTGVNLTRDLDPLDVRRVALDMKLGGSFFRAMLAMPWLAY